MCLTAAVLALAGCGQDWEADPYDLDFDIPRSEDFAESLSFYTLYQEPMAALQPAEGVLLYDLSSELFTDYAYKQRLMKIPTGETIKLVDGRLKYPEGTVLAKTFYYPVDMRDDAGAAQIIETRLLVKAGGLWNTATYLWNAQQTDATLLLEGTRTEISWTDEDGKAWTTHYAVPHEGECVTCHQSGGASAYIGPTVANLNRAVTREGATVNQLTFLFAEGVLEEDWASSSALPDYTDTTLSLESRVRAYLEINCAHCHNPGGWDDASNKKVDFRYTTPLEQTGIQSEARALKRQLETGEMPYLGTTLQHEEGVRLILDYVNSL